VMLLPDSRTQVFNSPSLFRELEETMADYASDRDYILPIGDPAAIAVVCIVAYKLAVMAHGDSPCVSLLKWDRQERTYYPVDLEL